MNALFPISFYKQWWIHHPKLAKTSECNDGLIKIGRVDKWIKKWMLKTNKQKMNAVHKILASKVLWNKNLEPEFIYKSNTTSQKIETVVLFQVLQLQISHLTAFIRIVWTWVDNGTDMQQTIFWKDFTMFYMNHSYKSIYWLSLKQLDCGQATVIHFGKIMRLLLDHEEFSYTQYRTGYWWIILEF